MKICPRCEKEFPSGTLYCPVCGAQLKPKWKFTSRKEKLSDVSLGWSGGHDTLAGMFYVVGSIMLMLSLYALIMLGKALEMLPPELKGFYILMFFLSFWSAITQFVIGWLVKKIS